MSEVLDTIMFYFKDLSFFQLIFRIALASFLIFWLYFIITIPFMIRDIKYRLRSIEKSNIETLNAIREFLETIEPVFIQFEPQESNEVKEIKIKEC